MISGQLNDIFLYIVPKSTEKIILTYSGKEDASVDY
jgi:hypothetical protein